MKINHLLTPFNRHVKIISLDCQTVFSLKVFLGLRQHVFDKITILFWTQIHPDEIEKENAFHRAGTDYQDS